MAPSLNPNPLTVSVLVPVYNEFETLGEVVTRLLAMPVVSEVVVVDDGSDAEGLPTLSNTDDPRLVRLRHEQNRGKGAAIRTALERATGRVVVVQDADLEYAPEEIPELVRPLFSGEADVAYGTRFADGASAKPPVLRYLANRLLTRLSNLATGLALTDMETGHKAFLRSALSQIQIEEDRFGFEPEVTAKLARRGSRFVELPVAYTPRSYAEGKKIGVRDGLRALWCIWKYSR